MRIELLNQSKYRHGSRPGDDVPLIVPGVVFGVFDGATDALSTEIDGISAGRLAALTVAAELAAFATEPDARRLPAREIIDHLSRALCRRTDPLGLVIPPSTTVAAVLDCGAEWRFLLIGDTGIRINGETVLRHEKKIDEVSTEARVRIFQALSPRLKTGDATERAARRTIMLGLDTAIAEEVFSAAEMNTLIEDVIATTQLAPHSATVERFLRGGIRTQFTFGNATGPLGFDTMNGTTVPLEQLIDEYRPKSQVMSLEIFTDGYPAMPQDVTPDAWEAAFQEAERIDFHKTSNYRSVKGSTEMEFFDDRTVLILSDMLDVR